MTNRRAASIDLKVEARLPDGSLMGSTGGWHTPDLTGCNYLGIATDDAQYGFDIWLRVLDRNRVRWWLRGLKKTFTESEPR